MDEVKRRARRAYELTRLQQAMPWGLAVAIVGVASAFLIGPQLTTTCLCVAIVLFGRWWGGDASRAVPVGLSAGALGLSGPALYALSGTPCTMACDDCFTVCLASAVGMGAVIVRSTWRGPTTASFILGQSAVAASLAGIGCVAMGAFGLIGVAVGVAAAVPTLAVRSAWASRAM